MPKKKTSKVVKGAATKKAKAPAKKSVVPIKKKTTVTKVAKAATGSKPVAAKGAVGFRLRMEPGTHKQLQKMAQQKDVSINTMLNQLIKDAK